MEIILERGGGIIRSMKTMLFSATRDREREGEKGEIRRRKRIEGKTHGT